MKPSPRSRSPRGYALLLVIMLLAVVAAGLAGALFALGRSADTSRELIARRQAFHATDGAMRSALRLTNDYLRTHPAATSAQLSAYFTPGVLDTITPEGYRRERFTVTTAAPTTGPVPNGPFAGMSARLSPVSSSLKLRETRGDASLSLSTSVALAQIAAFQFFVFSDGYTDWYPDTLTAAKGRTHVNGDLCVGGAAGFALERASSSGRITQISDDNRCRNVAAQDRTRARVAVAGQCASFPSPAQLASALQGGGGADGDITGSNQLGFSCTLRELIESRDNDCSTAQCTGGWSSYAATRWAGGLKDQAHGVHALKLPMSSVPLQRAGVHAGVARKGTLAAAAESNRGGMRFLTDPLLPDEPADVAEQKLMWKADIRIINGVWYLRNTSDPRDIGTPIWSDHPGSLAGYSTQSVDGIRGAPKNVGQADIAAAQSWGNITPRGYSYYPMDRTEQYQRMDPNVPNAQRAVISYGTLLRDTTGATAAAPASWRPGYRMMTDGTDNAGDEVWCTAGVPNGGAGGGSGSGGPNTTQVMRDATTANAGCSANATRTQNLLHATQSGFKDGHAVTHAFRAGASAPTASNAADGARDDSARVLPVNFDVAAFQAALANNGAGELGNALSRHGRAFNGIVYVAATWPGQNTASSYSATSDASTIATPGTALQQNLSAPGNIDYRELAPATTPSIAAGSTTGFGNEQRHHTSNALPWPLCGSAATTNFEQTAQNGGSNGNGNGANGSNARFTSALCDGGVSTRPNALRVINGAVINPSSATSYAGVTVPAGRLPDGLTIVTNLPVFVLGNLNTTSLATSATGAPWAPVLIGGDVLYTLSNAWDDARSSWGGPLGDVAETGAARTATTTTYNAAFMAGWTVTEPSSSGGAGLAGGGVQGFTRYLESWSGSGAAHNVNGAFFVVGSAVTWPVGMSFGARAAAAPPTRAWAFDEHLASLDNQPPGAPAFNISATKAWSYR